MSENESSLAQHYRVLVKLAKSESMGRVDLDSSLREITEAAAHTLDIARVNVWLYDAERTKITCIDHYDLASGEHSKGAELRAADYPRYFRALDEHGAIVANDAQTDPHTSEFTEGYLDVHGITSMMDAPLHSRGSVIGILCHEHIGPARVWTNDEQQFAASLADLATLALESSERLQAEDALKQSEARTREILQHALDAIVSVDESSVILDWNPRAEIVFGWSREEVLGKTLFETVIPPAQHERHREGVRRFLRSGEGPVLNTRIEVSARDKSGREFPVELSVSPLRIGDSWVFSAFMRDITARVRAEQEIHELNAKLEERVHERTRQLEAAVQQKERLLEELKANSLELVARLRELEVKSMTIRKDLERAQIIQRALLPPRAPQFEEVHLDALYRPGTYVGGDLYDIARLDDGRIALYVADATGHGVSAAMLSVLFKQRLEMTDSKGRPLEPAEVLRRVNGRLYKDVLTPGLFLTTAYALLDTNTLELRAASAGHTPMLLLRASGEVTLLERTGPALGIDFAPEFREHRVQMSPGDRLLLYTDGLVDGATLQGPAGIREMILPTLERDESGGPECLRELYREAEGRAQACNGRDGADDVTLLLLEIGSGPSHVDNDPEAEAEPVHELLPAAGAQAPETEPSEGGEPRPAPGCLWALESETETYLAVRGRGTWSAADAFRSLAKEALESGKRLRVDLSDCVYLDSAFLGTLHEIVTLGATGEVDLHGPSEAVRGLFEELGLEDVIASIAEAPLEAPAEAKPVPTELPTRETHRLLLRAHEALCELGEENRSRFERVVQMLREEIGEE